MYWILFILVGLNLGGALAGDTGESSGSSPDPIASLNKLIEENEEDYVNQIELARELLEGEPNSEILKAFVALEQIANRYSQVFNCDKNSVKESLARLASMRELLRPLFKDDLLNSRVTSTIPIVRSTSKMEKRFLTRCLIRNVWQLSPTTEPWVKLKTVMQKFEGLLFLSLDEGRLSQQARRFIAEERYKKPLLQHSSIAYANILKGPKSPDENLRNFCDKTCGTIVGPVKGMFETGLDLLEAASACGLEMDQRQWMKFSWHLDYLLCMKIRDNLATKASSSRGS